MPTEPEIAYVAGLIDGEGTITIGRQRGQRMPWNFNARLLFVNTDLRLAQRCQEVLGCGIIYQAANESWANLPENWSPLHRFQAVSRQARLACELLRPYLIAKAEHADIVLAMPRRRRGGPGGAPSDPVNYRLQEEAFARITALNRRGRKSSLVQ